MAPSVAWSLSQVLLIGFGAMVDAPVAAAQAQSAQTATIVGTVVAREDGRAVPEAVVIIEGTALVAVTNAVGRFRIESVRAGDVVLVVQASGFLDLRAPSVQVRADETLQLSVELEVTPNFMERISSQGRRHLRRVQPEAQCHVQAGGRRGRRPTDRQSVRDLLSGVSSPTELGLFNNYRVRRVSPVPTAWPTR